MTEPTPDREPGAKKMSAKETRLSVATNAAATAMFGCGTGKIEIDDMQAAAAETIAARVLEHIDEYDAETSRGAQVPSAKPSDV